MSHSVKFLCHLMRFFNTTLSVWVQVVAVLLNAGVDPAQQDTDGNTVLHKLILNIFYHPEDEENIMGYFHAFLALIRQDQLKPLFSAENQYGLRALELACQHGKRMDCLTGGRVGAGVVEVGFWVMGGRERGGRGEGRVRE